MLSGVELEVYFLTLQGILYRDVLGIFFVTFCLNRLSFEA